MVVSFVKRRPSKSIVAPVAPAQKIAGFQQGNRLFLISCESPPKYGGAEGRRKVSGGVAEGLGDVGEDCRKRHRTREHGFRLAGDSADRT